METLIDTVVGGFLGAIQAATLAVAPYGLWLLGVLAILAYYFRFAPYVTSSGAGLGDAIGGLIFLMLGIGFTQWIVLNIVAMGDALYLDALLVGLGGVNAPLSADQLRNPSFILQMHRVVTRPLEDFVLNNTGIMSMSNWPTVAGFWLSELVIYIVFMGIALHMGMIVIEFYFSLLAATVLVPTVVFAPSAFLGEWVVGWVLGCTVRVLLITAVVGIAVPLFEVLSAPAVQVVAGADPRWVEALGVVAGSLLFGIIAWVVPGRSANMIGHGLGLSWSTVAAAAASSMRGARMAQSAIRGTSRLLARA